MSSLRHDEILLQFFGSEEARSLFGIMAIVARDAQRRAHDRNLSEEHTRDAIYGAIDFVARTYLWRDGRDPTHPAPLRHLEPGEGLADRKPHVPIDEGREAAIDRLYMDDDAMTNAMVEHWEQRHAGHPRPLERYWSKKPTLGSAEGPQTKKARQSEPS